MDKGRRGQDQLPRTMAWSRSMMTLLLLCIIFLTMQSVSDTSRVSSRLPTQILMTAIVAMDQKPMNLDYLYFSWEHDGRPLVEYRDNNVTTYEPRALLPLDQLKDGNISLILVNLTLSDTGNYTCLIEYNKQKWSVLYTLNVEKHRIQLFNLSSKKVEENIEKSVHRLLKLLKGPVKQKARESKGHINIWGFSPVLAKPGENISLVCRFSTDSSMELTMLDISWSKDGVIKYAFNKTFPGYLNKLEGLSRGYANLDLISVQKEDSGKYVCNIKYRVWQKNITTLLIVKDDDKEDSMNKKENITIYIKEKADAHKEDDSKFWKEKIGMIVGVIVGVNLLAFVVFFCVVG